MKFRPGTGEADYQIKLRNLTRFLTEGDKAKVTLGSAAVRWCTRTSGASSWTGFQLTWPRTRVVEQNPLMEGKQMIMVFAPKKK